MYSIVQSHQYLQQYNIKPSVQRTAVINYLFNNRTHPTVDEIYLALSPAMPTLSKTTVYNTLNLFVERGAVRTLVIDEKNARFDIDTSDHAHFICKKCGKIYDIFNLKPEIYQLPFSDVHDIEGVEVSYSGVCKICKGN